ncbi:Smr/MutS family protein [Ideonella sp. A 288]|uniref:Smr/MutS family protein n=1 Tax=Ideonella sp. A 288 TaxID=1962181 RepID=UPI000B4BDFE5|nr:Smr/MutS family protein [Ideonella sp. A 288]
MKLRSLTELGPHWKAARETNRRHERETAERALRERDQRRRQQVQHDLFARSVGPVHPIRDRGMAEIDLPRPPPHPRQRELDEQAAVRASMSDEVTLESLLLTDDGLSFRRAGIGPDVVTRLRRGHWALQGQLDLHGLNREEARDALAAFVREAHRRGMRCIRVVHGKGHGSPGRQSVLKAKVQRWLAQRNEVIAFAQATGPQGGAGALVVLLAGL